MACVCVLACADWLIRYKGEWQEGNKNGQGTYYCEKSVCWYGCTRVLLCVGTVARVCCCVLVRLHASRCRVTDVQQCRVTDVASRSCARRFVGEFKNGAFASGEWRFKGTCDA